MDCCCSLAWRTALADMISYCFAYAYNDSVTGQRSEVRDRPAPLQLVRVSLLGTAFVLLFFFFLNCSSNRFVSLCPSSRCVWCQTTVHDDCMHSVADADQCDLGEFHSLIIPPHYLYHVNKLRRRHPEEYSKVLRM